TVIIAAGSATDVFSRFVSKGGQGSVWLGRISGLLLLAAAAYLVYNAPTV
ncbi:MAG: cytochrome C biogenesis protein, partial [Synergistetes bacterium HGW-Synergistetes-2]